MPNNTKSPTSVLEDKLLSERAKNLLCITRQSVAACERALKTLRGTAVAQ